MPRACRDHRKIPFIEARLLQFCPVRSRSPRESMKSPSAGQESEKLLSADNDGAPPERKSGMDTATLLKYGSLAFLILQNSSHVLLLRYSRVVGGECSKYVVRVPDRARFSPRACLHVSVCPRCVRPETGSLLTRRRWPFSLLNCSSWHFASVFSLSPNGAHLPHSLDSTWTSGRQFKATGASCNRIGPRRVE